MRTANQPKIFQFKYTSRFNKLCHQVNVIQLNENNKRTHFLNEINVKILRIAERKVEKCLLFHFRIWSLFEHGNLSTRFWTHFLQWKVKTSALSQIFVYFELKIRRYSS